MTGYFGSATEKAVRAFQDKYNLVRIKTRSSGYGRVGPIIQAKIQEVCAGVVPFPPPGTPILIISPAGDEVWQKGSVQKIAWDDFYTGGCDVDITQPCHLSRNVDTPDVIVYPYYTYDIYLTSAPIVCVTTPCPVAPSFRFTIAKGIAGNSYAWTVGKIINAAADEGVGDGTYSIRIQRAGQDVATQSNAFTINSAGQANGLLSIKPNSFILAVGKSQQVRAYYQPPMPPCSPDIVCVQVLPIPYEVDATWSSSNPSVVDFEYAVPACEVGKICAVRTQVLAVGKGAGSATTKAAYTSADGTVLTATANVTVGGSGTNLPPVISGISGPTTLSVGEVGTWTVKASDPENGPLSYTVFWGDEGTTPLPLLTPLLSTPVLQSTTFTHSYAKAGSYQPTFLVTDNQGLSTKTSIGVAVGQTSFSVKVLATPIQPSATLAVRNSVVPFTSFVVAPSESVVLRSITVRRRGLSSDKAFKEIVLIKDFGGANSGANYVVARGELNPTTHEAILTSSLQIVDQSSFIVAGVMPDDLAAYAGQVAYFEVTNATFASYVDGNETVSVPLAILGAGNTINNSLTTGGVTITKDFIYGDVFPGSPVVKRYFTFTNGPVEDVLLHNIVFWGTGGKILVNGVSRICSSLGDGTTREQCYFKEALPLVKGGIISIETDATLDSALDVRITGNVYGYQIVPVIK